MKKLELHVVANRKDCDIRLYKSLPLSMVLLQSWFNDQYKCFERFVCALTDEQCLHLFDDENILETVKVIYKGMWFDGQFQKVAIRDKGVHRRFEHLVSSSKKRRGFTYWVTCVFREVSAAGGLEAFMGNRGTVEEAHSKFKPWFYKSRRLVRGLNAADAARILARYGYLEPEARPLLARGALRGAAIILDGQPSSKDIDQLEREYGQEATRLALEKKAAEYIANSEDFSGRFQMEEGESWFCALHKDL